MAEIINLRQARKAKSRAEAKGRAAENRLKHGRTKGEKRLVDMDRQKLDSTVEGARRDQPDNQPE